MDALWVLPLVILAVGLAAIAVLVRRLAEVTDGLRQQLAEFAEIQRAVAAVRVETNTTRSALDGLSRR